jgi:hypothetical protein
VAACGGGEAVMLDRHVSEQVSETPASTRRHLRQVVDGDGRDHVNTGQHGNSM